MYNSLHHIYQAWQQGNENYVLDYTEFVKYLSKEINQSYEDTLNLLKTYYWFRYIDE